MMTNCSFRMALGAALLILASCVVVPQPGPSQGAYPNYAPYAYVPTYPAYPWYFGPEISIGVGLGRGWHGGAGWRGGGWQR